MDATTRLPWFKFWAHDELGYAPLAMCSLEAQGFFGRLRAYLHLCSDPYGHLPNFKNSAALEELVFALRVNPPDFDRLVSELENRRVIMRTPEGLLYSPRMVKTEEIRKNYAEKGRLGGLARTAQAAASDAAQAPAQADSVKPLKLPLKDRVRARASSALLSSSSALGVQGGESETDLPPHIPDKAEFLAHFMADGIPSDYLENQFVKFAGDDAWLTSKGAIRDFRLIVRQRWKQDAARYRRNLAEEKNAEPADREKRKAEIERLLTTEKDPAKRAALLAELKRLAE